MYTLKEAAEKLGISIVTLRRYIKQGKLPAKKVGKEYRIAEADVDALITEKPLAEPDEIVKEVLETNAKFKWQHERSDALRRAVDILMERGETDKAEDIAKDALIFGYRLIVQARAEKKGTSNRGRFSPRMTGKDAEGNDAAWPDPALIDEELVQYAKGRADTVKNAYTNAVYSDLVYEYSKNADRPVYGKQAFRGYIKAAKEPTVDDRLFDVQSNILRAMEIALELKDDTMFSESTTVAINIMKSLSAAGKMRILHEIIEELLKHPKKLDAATITVLARLIDDAATYYIESEKNEHLARSFIELRRQLPAVKSDSEEQKKVQRDLFDSYIREGESKDDQGMVAAHFYSEALQAAGGVLSPEEQTALRQRIEQANLKAEADMQEHSFTFTIKNEDIKKYIDAVLVDDIEKSLIRIALLPGLVPSVARAEENAKEMLDKYPISQMVSHSSLQDGRVVSITPGGLELSENHIYARLSEDVSVHGMFLGFLFDELKKRGLDAEKLSAFLAKRDFFDNEAFPGTNEAISLYFDEKYFSAVTVLLTQIEQLFRLANRKLGIPTLTSLPSGEQRVIYPQKALENLKPVLDSVSPDVYPYFCLVLWDKRGPGLRDTAAHGLLEHGSANKQQANLLIQLLLILAVFEYKKSKS